MSIAAMQSFARLRAGGDSTVGDRLAMLRDHRSRLAERIRSLQQNAAALDEKIDHDERLLDEQPGTDHV
ncbi:MerR family DNA-binding protein [Streptomyces sp. 8N616]|uniref:MerR family DNA-binding protein n=1 Tax=Streptomyces sp. 8N616 TaxID=3457414 RepID=UPI003FD42AB8